MEMTRSSRSLLRYPPPFRLERASLDAPLARLSSSPLIAVCLVASLANSVCRPDDSGAFFGGSAVVPIARLAEDRGIFGPELIKAMTQAYECALATLRLKDRSDPACQLVATTIIQMVENGTHDAHALYEQVVARFATAQP